MPPRPTVNGTLRIRLQQGQMHSVNRQEFSLDSLYVLTMATMAATIVFESPRSEGFIYIWGLPARALAASLRR